MHNKLIITILLIIALVGVGVVAYSQLSGSTEEQPVDEGKNQVEQEASPGTSSPPITGQVSNQVGTDTADTVTDSGSSINTSEWNSYVNEEIGFSFFYPTDLSVEAKTGVFQGSTWNMNVVDNPKKLSPNKYWKLSPTYPNCSLAIQHWNSGVPVKFGNSFPLKGVLVIRDSPPFNPGRTEFFYAVATPSKKHIVSFEASIERRTHKFQELARFFTMVSTLKFLGHR